MAAVVALPFVAAAATPLVYRALGERTAYYAAAVALACFGMVASLYGAVGAVSIPWIPAMGVELAFYVDGLAVLVGFLASGVGVLIFTYSAGYMHDEPGKEKYYATLLAFMGSMLGVAFAADLVALFVFWELTSISSFILIGHYGTRSSQYAARKAMLITVGGGLFMLVGFVVLHAVTGTWSLIYMLENADAVYAALESRGLLAPVVALVGVGAAAKSAQVPLHVWLPDAMEAPTPVSAFLHSATMVKAGVYLVGRFRPLLLGDEWTLLFAVLGLVTMTVAAILAVQATDIKELLAYSTASHLGLIVAGFGLAEVVGAETGAFHILNHAAFKAALFLVAGIVAHEAGTRRLDHLGGLAEDLPVTAGVAGIAALGMAGVPPFNGFYSKELLFEATWEAAVHHGDLWWLLPVVAVFGSVFTFLYSIRFLAMFWGEKPRALGHVHSPPTSMLAPPVLLAAFAGLVGLGGLTATFGVHLAPVERLVAAVTESVVPAGSEVHGFGYHVPTHLTPPVAMSVLTVGVGAVAYPAYGRLHRGLRAAFDRTPPLAADWWYDATVAGLATGGAVAARTVQNGLLRTYATWILATASALTLAGYAATAVSLPAFTGLQLAAPITLVLTVAVVAAVAVSAAPSHVAGVLTLSILGFMVAIFYILGSAPDLALTQLVVETLTLVIFLLVLDKLPAYYGGVDRWRGIRDAALSLLVGGTVALTVLLSTASTPDDGIAPYFVEEAVPQGGGGNVVNVILVDFRAFDTMGEISVVGMAALSVLTLVAMRERGETQ